MPAGPQKSTERIRYFLGLCSKSERERIELEYFEDGVAFQKMLAAEDDLIDAYARGELTVEQRRLFEKYFLTSLRGRDRVKFARALSLSLAQPLKIARGWTGAARVAAVVAVIFLLVVVPGYMIQRSKRGSELRTDKTGITNPSRGSQYNSLDGATPQPDITDAYGRLADPVAGRATKSAPRRVKRQSPRPIKNARAETATAENNVHDALSRQQASVNTQDASLGNMFERRQITQLPMNERNVVGLLSLPPAFRPPSFSLLPRNTRKDMITITLRRSLTLMTFRLDLDANAAHQEYRAAIETADGRPVTSLRWIEIVDPARASILTPQIPTADLPTGDYSLLLAGKKPDGSFVRVAEYSFKVISR